MKKLFISAATLIFAVRLMMNVMLAALVGHTAVELSLMSLQPVEITTLTAMPTTESPRSEVNAQIEVTAITEAYLLGRPTLPKKVVAPPPDVPPPKTQLQLKLQGIYYSSKPQASFAMIATAQGNSAHYQSGDTLPGGAVVDTIYPKHVILLRDARRETLYLEGSEAQHLADQVHSQHTANHPLTPEQLLGQYQQQLHTHPEQLMQLVQLAPVNQEGQFIGYRLRPGQNASLMSQFNLEPGDILTAVNGINLNSPLKGFEVMQPLAHAQQIELQILREGQPLSFSFKIDQ